ncbi:MAG: histidinol-phosphatase, partial [Ruminococcus sp.]|nr:histidinol-phosphatase [Ruminococcus sp.]
DHAIVRLPDLHDLCIRGTDFLLLEMPYTDLTEEIIEGVDTIINRGDVKLIIAHIERYLNFTSMKNLEKLMQLDVLGQINAVSLKSMKGRSRCMKLIKKGFVHVLGSDMHRTDRDHVPVKQGFEIITKKFDDFDEFALRNGKMILTNESIEKILTL